MTCFWITSFWKSMFIIKWPQTLYVIYSAFLIVLRLIFALLWQPVQTTWLPDERFHEVASKNRHVKTVDISGRQTDLKWREVESDQVLVSPAARYMLTNLCTMQIDYGKFDIRTFSGIGCWVKMANIAIPMIYSTPMHFTHHFCHTGNNGPF